VIENKSNSIVELEEPQIIDNKIKVNLGMHTKGDNIKYKIVVKNDSDDDFELDNNSLNIDSKYIDYKVTSDDNSNIIKANTSKIIYLEVEYEKEVPEEEFETGVFNDKQNFIVNISNDDKNDKPNPSTGYLLTKTIVTLILLFMIFVHIYQKMA
jgi:hypothetical protein